MAKPDFNRIVDWPGKGHMTLGDDFGILRQIWRTNDPIAVTIFAVSEPHTIIEAWPIIAGR
jgi:hypothetical protein